MSNHELDKTDLGILSLLEDDSRLTCRQLGEELHKSPTAIQVRIRKLIDHGFIKNYTINVDHQKLGRKLTVYTLVEIRQHSHDSLSKFHADAIRIPGVLECSHLTGSYDFLLKVVVRDVTAYQDLLMNNLAKLPGVDKIQSLFMMAETKNPAVSL